MDCPAILAEVEANNRRVQELASEEGWTPAPTTTTTAIVAILEKRI